MIEKLPGNEKWGIKMEALGFVLVIMLVAPWAIGVAFGLVEMAKREREIRRLGPWGGM